MDALCLLVVLGILVLIPLWQMLFGRGPNNIRRLVRLDLAAFLVLTAGAALALAIVRNFPPVEAVCILVVALPAMIALAWLARYMIEEFVLSWRRRREQREQAVDLGFLNDTDPPIEATIVEDAAPNQTRP